MMIVLICCCSWICVSRYHSPMVFFCFVDIYPRPSFIFHFQFLFFGIIIYFFLCHDQSLWCSITYFSSKIFFHHSLFISNSCFLVLSLTCSFLFHDQSLLCSITNVYLQPFCLSWHFVLNFYCWLSIVVAVVLHLFTVHWFSFSMLFAISWFIQVLLWVLGDFIFYCGIWGTFIEYGYWGIIIYHWVFHFLFTFLSGFIRFSSSWWFVFFLNYFEIGEHNGDFCYMFSF